MQVIKLSSLANVAMAELDTCYVVPGASMVNMPELETAWLRALGSRNGVGPIQAFTMVNGKPVSDMRCMTFGSQYKHVLGDKLNRGLVLLTPGSFAIDAFGERDHVAKRACKNVSELTGRLYKFELVKTMDPRLDAFLLDPDRDEIYDDDYWAVITRMV